MNVKQLREMLEGIPDDTDLVVSKGNRIYIVTGLWFQNGMIIFVAPSMTSVLVNYKDTIVENTN